LLVTNASCVVPSWVASSNTEPRRANVLLQNLTHLSLLLQIIQQINEIRYSDFIEEVETDHIEKVSFSADGQRLLAVDTDGTRVKMDALPNDPDLLTILTKHKASDSAPCVHRFCTLQKITSYAPVQMRHVYTI
jgi:hypothetical protein